MRISDWSSDVCSSDLLTAFYCRFSGRLDEPTEIAGPAVSIGRCRRPRRGGQELHRRLCLRKLRDRLLPLSDRRGRTMRRGGARVDLQDHPAGGGSDGRLAEGPYAGDPAALPLDQAIGSETLRERGGKN